MIKLIFIFILFIWKQISLVEADLTSVSWTIVDAEGTELELEPGVFSPSVSFPTSPPSSPLKSVVLIFLHISLLLLYSVPAFNFYIKLFEAPKIWNSNRRPHGALIFGLLNKKSSKFCQNMKNMHKNLDFSFLNATNKK